MFKKSVAPYVSGDIYYLTLILAQFKAVILFPDFVSILYFCEALFLLALKEGRNYAYNFLEDPSAYYD